MLLWFSGRVVGSPKSTRRDIDAVKTLLIDTPSGAQVPLHDVAALFDTPIHTVGCSLRHKKWSSEAFEPCGLPAGLNCTWR